MWSMSGDVLLEMVGHTAIVYAVAVHKSGIIASGSEDCFAKLWKGSNLWNLHVKLIKFGLLNCKMNESPSSDVCKKCLVVGHLRTK